MGDQKEPVQEKIDELVSRIVERFRPEKIILFGSHARGTAGQDSDADILVVMPVKGSKRKKATEIDVALVGIDLPVDVIVVTPEELERNKNQIGTIIYPALKEGKVLYEKAA
jgi:predicted nucleotidyltransferase